MSLVFASQPLLKRSSNDAATAKDAAPTQDRRGTPSLNIAVSTV